MTTLGFTRRSKDMAGALRAAALRTDRLDSTQSPSHTFIAADNRVEVESKQANVAAAYHHVFHELHSSRR
jgi:hypothetical protein